MKDIVVNGYCTESESIRFETKKCENKLPKSIWETYSAFANTFGGCIALGFSELPDKRLELTGIDDPEKITKEFWDLVNDKKKVSVNLLSADDVKVIDHEGTKYILIHVPRADRHHRPVYISDNVHNGTYKRNNESDYHCTLPEIMAMGRDATDDPLDREPIPEASMDDLEPKTVETYRNMLRTHNPGNQWVKEPTEEFLRLIGAAEKVDGKYVPTIAGLLMFGKDHRITRIFPSYFIDYLEYKEGVEWTDRFHSDSGLWSGNLFDFYLEASNRISRSGRQPFSLNGFTRLDDTDLMKAEREAMLNGIVHADYRGTTGVRVELHNDFIRINNPGCFRIPPEKAMRGGHTDARNPVIMKMFSLAGLVERSGSGLYRIARTCSENGFRLPRIIEGIDPDVVTFEMDLVVRSDDIEGNVLLLMRGNPKIKAIDIAKNLDVSISTVNRTIDKLKSENRLARRGGPRGSWEIL